MDPARCVRHASWVLVAATAWGCHPRLPPVAGCTPGAWRCHDDRPELCSPSERWEPVGDVRCDAAGSQACRVVEGVAGCVRADGDGGAP